MPFIEKIKLGFGPISPSGSVSRKRKNTDARFSAFA